MKKCVKNILLASAFVSVLFTSFSCHGSKAADITIDKNNYPNVKLYPVKGNNGHWYFNDVDSGVLATEGVLPEISNNNTWRVGEIDTGIEVIFNNTYIKFDIPKEFDTSRNFEITFWDKNDTNPVQQKIYEDAATNFSKYYPNIKVNIKHYVDYTKIYESVITNIQTKTTPNICISYPDHVATYLSGNNIVTPLDDLINDSKYGLGGSAIKFESVKKDEIVPKFLNEGIINEHYYTMPFMRSSECLYMNKDYVESLGYKIPDIPTWDWIFEVSEKALKENDPKHELIPFIYKSEDNMMIQMLKQLGGNYSTDKGDVLLFEEPKTKEILDKWIKPHATSKAFSTFTIVSYPGNKLNAGKALFGIDSTAGATWMGSNGPNQSIDLAEIQQFETAVRPIPQFDVNNPQMISQGPSLCLFNKKDPQEVLASWLFMQYLLTNETQINYSKTEGYVPVTLKAQNSEVYKDYLSRSGEDNDEHYYVKIAASKLVIENMNNTFITPVFNGSSSLRSAAGQLIVELVRSCVRGDEINDNYYINLFNKMSKLFRITEIGNNVEEVDYSFKSIPSGGKSLLFIVAGVWVLIAVYFLLTKIKKKPQN